MARRNTGRGRREDIPDLQRTPTPVDPGDIQVDRGAEERVNDLRNQVGELTRENQQLRAQNAELRAAVEDFQASAGQMVPISEVRDLVQQANQYIEDAYRQGQQSVIDYLRQQGILQ